MEHIVMHTHLLKKLYQLQIQKWQEQMQAMINK